MNIFKAMLLIAVFAVATGAGSQNIPIQAGAAGCPSAAQVSPVHLYGLWRAEFEDLPPAAMLRFERHPELVGSVSGTINRDATRALVSGDVDDGQFALEESFDGQRIAATWIGEVVENSCGKEIRGTWNNVASGASHPFVLRKLPGWQ